MGEMSSSSARFRRQPRSSVLLWVVVAVTALVVVLVATWSDEEDPPPTVPVPTQAPVVSPTPVIPTPTPLPSPTPSVVPGPQPTPTPTPTLIPLPTRKPRRPPAEPRQCIEYQWMITPNSPSLGHNVVEIRVNNSCDTDLTADDLWFEACGFRDGGLVQRARARAFEGVRRNNRTTLAFDLPGSVDWYDDIKVEWQSCYP